MRVARQRLIENFSRAAHDYDAHAEFQHTETLRVLDAALMFFPPAARVLDIGCGTGYFAEKARHQRPHWRISGVDIASGMCAAAASRCHAIQADAAALPVADASCDAVVSSLCLQWVEDLPRAFREVARVLKPGGWAVIASLGTESLHELRAVAMGAELPLGLLAMQPAAHYRMAIEENGLTATHFEQKHAVDYYPSVSALLDSMRHIGAGNNFAGQPRGLTGAQRWKTMIAAYEKLRVAEGIPATWDRLFMLLRKPL